MGFVKVEMLENGIQGRENYEGRTEKDCLVNQDIKWHQGWYGIISFASLFKWNSV